MCFWGLGLGCCLECLVVDFGLCRSVYSGCFVDACRFTVFWFALVGLVVGLLISGFWWFWVTVCRCFWVLGLMWFVGWLCFLFVGVVAGWAV